jgi:hypothetical protein
VPGASPSPDAGQAAAEAALREGAVYLGVSPSDMHLDELTAHEWGDASLGCPRPGILYAQVVTPGFVVVVSGAGTSLEYHADGRGRVVLCKAS